MNESQIKKHLVKEASQRVSMSKVDFQPIKMQDALIKKDLMQEAYDRLFRLKYANTLHKASLEKEGMAFSPAARSMHTATNNLSWIYPEVGRLSQGIKNNIEEKFSVYRKAPVGGQGKAHPVQSGLFWDPFTIDQIDDGNPDQKNGEPEATLVMRFAYRRHIMPLEGSENYDSAVGVIESVNQFFQQNNVDFSMTDFINAIESANVPLNAYFHASDLGEERGGAITQSEIADFILDKLQHNQSLDPRTSGSISSERWFTPHYYSEVADKPMRMTGSHRSPKTFPNEAAMDIPYDSYALRALAYKIRQGYALNIPTLLAEINQIKEKVKRTKRLGPGDDTAILDEKYEHMGTNIINEFAKGMEVRFMEPDHNNPKKNPAPSGHYHWGNQRTQGKVGYRVGLATTGTKRYIKSNLSPQELRLLLKHCTAGAWGYLSTVHNIDKNDQRLRQDFEQNYVPYTDKQSKQYQTEADEFYIPAHSMVFSSNGLDSNPWEREGRMLLMPAVKKTPGGQIIYDSDNGNLGRNHLVKNWNSVQDRAGRVKEPALSALVEQWGPKTEAALQMLAKAQFNNKDAQLAWNTISTNRTNADATYDLINLYKGNWDAFEKKVLTSSIATAIDRYHQFLPNLDYNEQSLPLIRLLMRGVPLDENGQIEYAQQLHKLAGQMPKSPISSLVKQYPDEIDHRQFITGVFEICKNNIPEANPMLEAIQAYERTNDWDTLVQYMQNNGIIEAKDSDMQTRMDQSGFDSWTRYGYQLGKMMDFLSCLMYVANGERIERNYRKEKITDYVYGRKYSVSSGKGNGGQVMIGILYSYNADEVADMNTPEGQRVTKMINKERNRRHDAYRIKKDRNTYRQTSNWERLGERTVVINGKEVPIGEHEPLPVGAPPDPNLTSVRVIKVIENLEFFIGHAGSAEGMLQTVHRGSNWDNVLTEFQRRFPTLESTLNVLISPINIRFDLLELSAKKAIDNVRKNLEMELSTSDEIPGGKTSIEIQLKQGDRESILSSDMVDNDTSDLQGDMEAQNETNPNETINMPAEAAEVPQQPQPQPTQTPLPITPTMPEVIDTTVTGPLDTMNELGQQPRQTPPVQPGAKQPETKLPQEMPKSMEQNQDFVGKKKLKRSLVRRSPSRGLVNRSSVVKKLEKIAGKLDERGIILLADKIDLILRKINEG